MWQHKGLLRHGRLPGEIGRSTATCAHSLGLDKTGTVENGVMWIPIIAFSTSNCLRREYALPKLRASQYRNIF